MHRRRYRLCSGYESPPSYGASRAYQDPPGMTWSISVSPALGPHRRLLLVVVERVVLVYVVLIYAVGRAVVAQICGYVMLM